MTYMDKQLHHPSTNALLNYPKQPKGKFPLSMVDIDHFDTLLVVICIRNQSVDIYSVKDLSVRRSWLQTFDF